MATRLTNVAIQSRKAIRYGLYFIILFFIVRFSFGIIQTVYRRIFPPPPPKPEVAFQRLPSLPFPQKTDLPQFTYTLETPSGGLPVFKDPAIVYYMPRAGITLTSYEDAVRKATGMGFTGTPIEDTQTIYRFPHQSSAATLEINIVNGTFSISYNLANDPRPIERLAPAPAAATSIVKGFLASGQSSPADLTGPETHEFLKLDAQGLITTLSLADANLIKVKLFRKNYNELPAKTPDPNQANVWFIVSGDDRGARQIVAAEYHYFPIDEEQNSTYPIKSTEEAYQDLLAGKGYIANLGDNRDGRVTIRRVYLAYYDPGIYVEFYQPIFVFEGDRQFVGYVPAVTSEYYGN